MSHPHHRSPYCTHSTLGGIAVRVGCSVVHPPAACLISCRLPFSTATTARWAMQWTAAGCSTGGTEPLGPTCWPCCTPRW